MAFSGLIGSNSVIGPDLVSYGPSKSKSISKPFFHNIDLMIIFIIGMKFYFLVFIDVLTPANHSQIEYSPEGFMFNL